MNDKDKVLNSVLDIFELSYDLERMTQEEIRDVAEKTYESICFGIDRLNRCWEDITLELLEAQDK